MRAIRQSTIFCLLSLIMAYASGRDVYAADTVQVQVQSTILRASPSPWAGKVADTPYQEVLTLLPADPSQEKSGSQWIKVKTRSGKVGYVHVSAVTSRKVEVRGSEDTKSVSGSSSEVVLAGKGFGSKVENEYKRENPSLNFSLVDAVESYKPIENVQAFAKKGRLLG